MPIQVTCPACGRTLRVPDNLLGERVKCPSCFEQFTAASGPTPPPPRPPSTPEPPPAHAESYRESEAFRQARVASADKPADRGSYRMADEPYRPPRPPRPEDDDYDDDDFDRPRRRRRGPDREAALSRVNGPGLALMILGIVCTALGLGVIPPHLLVL